MLMTVLSFFPFITCLFWLVLNPLILKKDKASKALESLITIIAITSMANACMLCSQNEAMLTFLLIKQFFTLLIVPIALTYLFSLESSGQKRKITQGWVAAPVSLLFAEIILIMLVGKNGFIDSIETTNIGLQDEKTSLLIRLCSFWIYIGILSAELVYFLIHTTRMKGNSNIQRYNCIAVVLACALMETAVLISRHHTTIQITIIPEIVLSCAVFFLSYSGMFHHFPDIRFREMVRASVHIVPAGSEIDVPVLEPESGENTGIIHESAISDIRLSQPEEEKLRIRFEEKIVSDKLFLKQGIRLSDIATMLDTNRTYISRLVNNTYNMSFSDYINTLRIDYAKQYLMNHRDAKQSDIATACGFPNASAFNSIFKKITGVTPKIWMATN